MNAITKNHVVYVGPFSFPNGGAAARRILGNAQAIQQAGFSVVVACGQTRGADQGPLVHQGVEVISLGERTSEHLPRFLKHFSYINMGEKTVAWLDGLQELPYAIVLYSGYTPYLLRLIPWAKKNGVKLIFDAVEWYDPESFLGRFSPYQLNIEFAMRSLLPKARNIISISSYLHDYYVKQGCSSLIVPPTLDVRNTACRMEARSSDGPLKLVYAGSPGKKDLLGDILEAVFRLRSAGFDLRLSVAGITASQGARYDSVKRRSSSELDAAVDFKGVLGHSDSIDLVKNADFSVLLRHDARYSRAGFPTKFVESLAVGTPVIANLTSDLGRYMRNGETGFVCHGTSASDFEAALRKALSVSQKAHMEMRKQSREAAEQYFDYRVFSSQLESFIKSACV